jgi:hypothetical protein
MVIAPYEPRRPDFTEVACGLLATFGDALIADLSAASSVAFCPVAFALPTRNVSYASDRVRAPQGLL